MLVDPSDKDQQEEEYGEDEEPEDEEEDEYIDGRNPHQLIIINEHQFGEDDKKVVYLSNINSCSLPQTPKLDDQHPAPPNVSNLLEKSQKLVAD